MVGVGGWMSRVVINVMKRFGEEGCDLCEDWEHDWNCNCKSHVILDLVR